MGLLGRIFGRSGDEALPLYTAIVARARLSHWYEAGAVPDSVDGRFDMIAAILALTMLRLESDAEGSAFAARLAERFVDDMDGQLREIGIGDIIVGKHIGKMMSMLGGRIGAYRDALAGSDLDGALTRNLYRGTAPAPEALAHVRGELLAFHDSLAQASTVGLMEGLLP